MKIIKRITLIISVLLVIVVLFRGWFYRHLVVYKSIGLRTSYTVTGDKLADFINERSKNQTDPDIEQIIKLGLSITSHQLNFTTGKNDTDPNKLITSRAAHCVGYATFFATTCNQVLDKYSLADTWIAKPQIGQLYFLDVNIHQYFTTSFFKDHDFVIIENKKTGQLFAVDPTVNDYLNIDLVTYKSAQSLK